MEHPYITMPLNKQMKMSEKSFKLIFKPEAGSNGGRSKTPQPRLR